MSCDHQQKTSQALVCATNTSAIALWSALAAAGIYNVYPMATPFHDSLTEDQRALRAESCRQRRRVFGAALAGSAVVLGAAGARFLRWSS